jgi:hypothetical protein
MRRMEQQASKAVYVPINCTSGYWNINVYLHIENVSKQSMHIGTSKYEIKQRDDYLDT